MTNTQTNNWRKALHDQIIALSEEFGLDDMQTNRFRDFSVMLAQEQYRIGNKYGASWAFKRAREEAGQTLAAKPSA